MHWHAQSKTQAWGHGFTWSLELGRSNLIAHASALKFLKISGGRIIWYVLISLCQTTVDCCACRIAYIISHLFFQRKLCCCIVGAHADKFRNVPEVPWFECIHVNLYLVVLRLVDRLRAPVLDNVHHLTKIVTLEDADFLVQKSLLLYSDRSSLAWYILKSVTKIVNNMCLTNWPSLLR